MATIDLAKYDSRAVRAAASKLRSCARSLSDSTGGRIRNIKTELPSHMEGEAAKALQQRVGELSTDINSVIGGLNGLAKALEKYAGELEATAARLKRLMAEN